MLIKTLTTTVALSAALFTATAFANPHAGHESAADRFFTTSPDAKVFIVSPADGDTVPSTFTVKFGAENVDIVPAGITQANSGHHHLLIDTEELPDLTKPLPTTDQILHFGKAQTETEITLEPGTHTLQLVLGNFAHVPHKTPVISEKITVTVKANDSVK